MSATGEAARAALTHLWAGEPSAVNRIAIQSVIRTSASDPAATEALLRRSLEPERLVSHGASDLWDLTNGIQDLLRHSQCLVHDIYTVVMDYEEGSEEVTSMFGGQLLSLTSNRRQDVEMAKYNLVRHYDHVLTAAPELAIQILRGVCDHQTGGAVILDANLAGRVFAIDLSGADWYDDRAHSDGHDSTAMLDAFERQIASCTDPERWLDLLVTSPIPVVIWRRVLTAAASNQALATVLGPLDEVVNAFAVSELALALAALLRAKFANADDPTRATIKAHMLESLPEVEPEEPEIYWTRELYLRLLHALDRSIVSSAVGEVMDATTKPRDSRFWVGSGIDPEPQESVDLSDPEVRRFAELVDAIKTFVSEHRTVTPTAEQLAARIGDINELEELIKGGHVDVFSQPAADLLVQVAVLWARCAPEVAGDLHVWARGRLLGAAQAARPVATGDHCDEPDSDFIVVEQGPRTDAGCGLTVLARLPDHVDDELIEAIASLAKDPVRSVRFEVISRITPLWRSAPEVAWRILRERAENETSQPVLRQVVGQAWKLRSESSQAFDVIGTIARRFAGVQKRHSATAACAEVSALQWVFVADDRARSILARVLDLDVLDADAIGSVLHNLRVNNCFVDDDVEIRRRTLEICDGLIHQGLVRIDPLQDDSDSTEHEAPWIREGAILLETVANQLYFAVGVHDAEKQNNRAPTPAELRLVDEAGSLFDILVAVPIAHIAHHLLEIQAFTLDARPSEALRAMATVVAGGTRGTGYAIESQAVKVLVSVVSSLLADHRSIFDDQENLTALRNILEVFVEEGTPDAHELIYGIGQIFH